jgi:predicted amidophosphoribosyltransferase
VCPACSARLRRPPRRPAPPGLDALHAAFVYEGVARELIARVKYRGARHAVRFLGRAVVDALPDSLEVVAVVPVPTTAARRRQRGFDHAGLLAGEVARLLGTPCRDLLRRLPGPPQTGLGAAERRAGPRFSPADRPPSGALLLVDDVVTTGATLTRAAATLRANRPIALHGACAGLAL